VSPPSHQIETYYRVFRDISRSVHSSTQVDAVLSLVVKRSTEVLHAKGAILRILNLQTHELELFASHGISERYLSKGPVTSETMITELWKLNKVIIIPDITESPRIQYPREALEEGFKMVLDVPLSLQEHTVGIIRVFFAEPREFSEMELDFVISIAEQCALAIDKARLIESQQSLYNNLVRQTEKLTALGRMAAGIAHEINNPLGGILLYSTSLIKKAPPDGTLHEGLEVIVNETLRCKRIIQELLEFSRERKPQKASANLNTIVERALSVVENEFRMRRIRVDKRLSTDIPESPLDANQLQQVLVNLLINAAEAIQENGTIGVYSFLGPDENTVTVEVTDSGCGIPPEHMDRIFEPFFSSKEKGTGLGLAVSFGIVRNHRGYIEVSSQPGQGSCFSVTLPVPWRRASKSSEVEKRDSP
jgi:two-component system, NtrC family, sensor kinase